MNLENKNGVSFLTFDAFKKAGVKHGFSTRIGGVSEGVFDSLNLGFNRGDSDENVRENYHRIANALDMNYDRMCLSKQTHTTNVVVVDEKDAGNGLIKPLPYDDVDGLITNVKDMPLVTFYADCVPLFFYDPIKQVIAMAHSGWKGTVERIGARMVSYMEAEYDSKPEDIICAIAPSICHKCYEVSEDVALRFLEVFGDGYGEDLLYKKENGKYQLNLHKACEITLLEAGITSEHLDITDICTCCNPEFLFSHRASNGMRGNLAGVMMLKEVSNNQ